MKPYLIYIPLIMGFSGGIYTLFGAAEVKIVSKHQDAVLRQQAEKQRKLDASFVGPPTPKKVVKPSDLRGENSLTKQRR